MAELNELMQRLNDLKAEQQKKEADVLFSDDAMIAIYQIKEDSPVRREIEFTNLESLHRLGYEVDSDNYELIYAIPANIDQVNSMDKGEYNSVLEDIYRIFNVDRPTDYPGYSLSVGHVIALRSQQSDGNYKTDFYYTDRYSFEKIDDFSLKLYQKYDSIRRFKYTNQPLSAEMLDILARSARGEVVTIDEINDTKEIRYCKTISENGIDTIYLSNRDDKRKEVMDYINSLGSATELDSDGHMQYNGYVERDARLDVVIGLPASGKSSAVVDVLSQEFHSRVIDNDMIKAGFTEEFRGGLGGQLLHKESKLLEKSIFRDALERNENIVFPKVGGSVSSISAYLNQARSYGYKIYLHFVHLQREKVYNRLLNRLINSGRYVEPELIDKYYPLDRGNLCKSTFDELKEDKTLISGYSEWNNDVDLGERPILIDYYNVEGRFIEEGVNRNGNNEHGRGKNASSIQADGNLRDVGSGGYTGILDTDGERAQNSGFDIRSREDRKTVLSERKEEISSNDERSRGFDGNYNVGDNQGRRDTDNRREEAEDRGPELYQERIPERDGGGRQNLSYEDAGGRNSGNASGEEGREAGADVSGRTRGISEPPQSEQTYSERSDSGIISQLDEASVIEANKIPYEYTMFNELDNLSVREDRQKCLFLINMSGRNTNGERFSELDELINSKAVGNLKTRMDSLDDNFNRKTISVETIYGTFDLSDISVFDKLPGYHMSNQNSVDWYSAKTDELKGVVVFNDNDILGCGATINGEYCLRNTELVNPLFNEAFDRVIPFPRNNKISYRFCSLGDDSHLDITLFEDFKDNGLKQQFEYKFYIEKVFSNGESASIAYGNVGENDLLHFKSGSIVKFTSRDTAIRLAQVIGYADVDDKNFVCYDLMDKGLSEEYMKKANYAYFDFLVESSYNTIKQPIKILCNDASANRFARLISEYAEDEISVVNATECDLQSYKLNDSFDLAKALNEWAYSVDTYDYNDRVSDKLTSVEDLSKDIDNGNIDGIEEYLKDYIDNNLDSSLYNSDFNDAKLLIAALEDIRSKELVRGNAR